MVTEWSVAARYLAKQPSDALSGVSVRCGLRPVVAPLELNPVEGLRRDHPEYKFT